MKRTTQKPAYLVLYEQLRTEIVSGARPFGSQLPSRRVQSRERNLSAVTVNHSYELLCEEGYIESRPQSGYYVIYRENDGFFPPARSGSFRPPQSAPADRDGFPFSVLARTMRRVLAEYGESLLTRTPGIGADALREALSRYLGRCRRLQVAPDQIIIGAGAEYLYGLVVELLGRDRVFGLEDPSYQKIRLIYEAKGISCRMLPMDGEGIRLNALRTTDASVLHITPYRSFPTGVTASASRRHEYLRWVGQGDRYLVEDDYESEFSLLRKAEEPLLCAAEGNNVLYMNTFSRTVSPSLRAGYLVLPQPLMRSFQERLGFYSCSVPAFEQYVLAELLDSGELEKHINRVRRNERKSEKGETGR